MQLHAAKSDKGISLKQLNLKLYSEKWIWPGDIR